jgi:hypothetical protein
MAAIDLAILDAITEAVFRCLFDRVDLELRQWLNHDSLKLSFQRVLVGTYMAFSRQYPECVANMFDGRLLAGVAASELAKLLCHDDHPDPMVFAELWRSQLGYPASLDLTTPAADFLRWLEIEGWTKHKIGVV